MGKKLGKILIFLLIMGVMTGCKSNHTQTQTDEKDNNIQQQTETKNYDVMDENGEMLIRITWQTPDLSQYFSGEALENAKQYYANLLSQNQEEWDFTLKDQAKEQKKREGKDFLFYRIDNHYAVTAETDSYISIQRAVTKYTGGSQESYTVYGETFLKKNGAILLFEDLFQADNYKEVLMEQIVEQMKKQTGISYYEDAEEQASKLLGESTQYYLTADSIVIVYQASDLAPYADGTQSFSIKLSYLKGILLEEYITT